ncbi:maleylpyruvate isomerase family mycothiol-dependent enzyme [Aeromicrobium sp. CF4.19]|uniref:maleylpyruvate isomerase family mycothiol-dependent enzyme n=1 Tax=Aeromicrobium sp. CF4.19 TaxID=3373082 RepID=UPI003EE69BE9
MTDDVQAMTSAQRRDLVHLLEGLTDAQWEAPSLCDGWRVQEVAAHLVMPFTVSVPRLLLLLARARFSFDRAADRQARRDADRGRPELVATLRANVDTRWQPPGGTEHSALSHDVIHGLDITRALGLPTVSPPQRIAVVLGAMDQSHVKGFGTDLAAQRFEATDVDVALGSGPEVVRGTAEEVLLAATGRTAASRPGPSQNG